MYTIGKICEIIQPSWLSSINFLQMVRILHKVPQSFDSRAESGSQYLWKPAWRGDLLWGQQGCYKHLHGHGHKPADLQKDPWEGETLNKVSFARAEQKVFDQAKILLSSSIGARAARHSSKAQLVLSGTGLQWCWWQMGSAICFEPFHFADICASWCWGADCRGESCCVGASAPATIVYAEESPPWLCDRDTSYLCGVLCLLEPRLTETLRSDFALSIFFFASKQAVSSDLGYRSDCMALFNSSLSSRCKSFIRCLLQLAVSGHCFASGTWRAEIIV